MLLLALALGCTPAPTALTAVSFNTGTSEQMGHDLPPEDGYGEAEAALSDRWYGDGLAWAAVVDDVARFLGEVRPDVVAFQEVFHSPECAEIPVEAHAGFVCETWSPGDPTVAEAVLGEGYQVACFQGKPDKCLGVREDFATLRGDLDGATLDGAEVEGCGSGSRVGRGTLDLPDGTEVIVVAIHGSSGLATEDEQCRLAQLELVFEDLDGPPAASGARNLVLGDFNTDPARLAEADPSAAYLAEVVADPRWTLHSDRGPEAEPSYGGQVDIDHVLSDFLEGSCWVAGVSEGHPPVSEVVYLDHAPVVCDLSE